MIYEAPIANVLKNLANSSLSSGNDEGKGEWDFD